MDYREEGQDSYEDYEGVAEEQEYNDEEQYVDEEDEQPRYDDDEEGEDEQAQYNDEEEAEANYVQYKEGSEEGAEGVDYADEEGAENEAAHVDGEENAANEYYIDGDEGNDHGHEEVEEEQHQDEYSNDGYEEEEGVHGEAAEMEDDGGVEEPVDENHGEDNYAEEQEEQNSNRDEIHDDEEHVDGNESPEQVQNEEGSEVRDDEEVEEGDDSPQDYHEEGEEQADEENNEERQVMEYVEEGGVYGDAAEDGEEYDEIVVDFRDPKVVIAETHRIEESMMILMRGLSSLLGQRDDEVRVNLLDICADLAAEEEMLFSPTPDYISKVQTKDPVNRKKTKSRGSTSARPTSSNFSEERRAFVDPRIPLKLPYSARRHSLENTERSQQRGTYHELFYGDRNAIEFKPPENNKRKEIEDRKRQYPVPLKREKPVYEPSPKKPKRVSKNFVPSCANVDNSEARKKLQDSKKYRNTRIS